MTDEQRMSMIEARANAAPHVLWVPFNPRDHQQWWCVGEDVLWLIARIRALESGRMTLHVGRDVAGRMVLCPICGNKRCPKATDATMRCTGSNAPGQVGTPAVGA